MGGMAVLYSLLKTVSWKRRISSPLVDMEVAAAAADASIKSDDVLWDFKKSLVLMALFSCPLCVHSSDLAEVPVVLCRRPGQCLLLHHCGNRTLLAHLFQSQYVGCVDMFFIHRPCWKSVNVYDVISNTFTDFQQGL